MGLWSEYFLKTPPGDSNMCPLSTPVVELAIQQLPKVLGFSQKDTGFSEKKFRSNETVCVFGEPTCIVYALYGYLHRCVKCISKCRRTFAAKSKVALALRQAPHKITPRFECYFFSLTILKPVLKH